MEITNRERERFQNSCTSGPLRLSAIFIKKMALFISIKRAREFWNQSKKGREGEPVRGDPLAEVGINLTLFHPLRIVTAASAHTHCSRAGSRAQICLESAL